MMETKYLANLLCNNYLSAIKSLSLLQSVHWDDGGPSSIPSSSALTRLTRPVCNSAIRPLMLHKCTAEPLHQVPILESSPVQTLTGGNPNHLPNTSLATPGPHQPPKNMPTSALVPSSPLRWPNTFVTRSVDCLSLLRPHHLSLPRLVSPAVHSPHPHPWPQHGLADLRDPTLLHLDASVCQTILARHLRTIVLI